MTTATLTPQKTTWLMDPTHTDVEFSVRHLMVSNVKGRFGNVTGSVAIDEANAGALAVEISIPVATIDTRVEQRDAHLRSADFFAVDQYPTMAFKGGRVQGDVQGDFQLEGELTIRGVTKPVTLDVVTEGRGSDPWGNERIGFSATTKIDRKDFGLTWNAALETGGVVVGDTVKITINAELMRPKD
jgi:polyisoprenoid-binding protein YceI